jgi:hypothetical protein
MQQVLTALQQLLAPIEHLAAAAAAVAAAAGSVGDVQQQQQVLQAAAGGWAALLQQLRLSTRLRLPDVSVIAAAVTALQRATANTTITAAAAAEDAGGGLSVSGAKSAPQQQQQQQQCDRAQAEWLLPQACSVLGSYARWLPEAVADGHLDLAKLLLQGQGQVRGSLGTVHRLVVCEDLR